MREDILYVAVCSLVLKLWRFIKKNTQITGLMAAILDFTRKRGFPQGGFGWGFMGVFTWLHRVKFR